MTSVAILPCVAEKSLNSSHSFGGLALLPKPTVFSTFYLGILTDNGGGGVTPRYKQIIKDSRPVHRHRDQIQRNLNVYKKPGMRNKIGWELCS